MKVSDINLSNSFSQVVISDATLEIDSIYCCDLLSIVMSKAPAGCAWITVMANVNSLAVATLADMSCIIFAEGVQISEEDKRTAEMKGINIFETELDIYSVAMELTKMKNAHA